MGEPTIVDPEPVTATGVVKELTNSLGGGNSKLKVETLNGAVPPNQEGAAFGCYSSSGSPGGSGSGCGSPVEAKCGGSE